MAHTHPHMATDILNKPGASSSLMERKKRERDENFWVTMMKVGPFEDWSQCVEYLSLWSNKIRGPMRRLERGLEIYAKYRTEMGLTMWAQKETKETVMKAHGATKRAMLNPMRRTSKNMLTGINKKSNKMNPSDPSVSRELTDDVFHQPRQENQSTIKQLKLMQHVEK